MFNHLGEQVNCDVPVIEYTVLAIQFRFVKYTVVDRLHKNFEQLFISIQAIQRDYKEITVCWRAQTTSKNFQTCLYCVYLLKLYDISIIIFLKNYLTKICGEISKIWLILWMPYVCRVKVLEEAEKLGWRLMYFALLTKIISVILKPIPY